MSPKSQLASWAFDRSLELHLSDPAFPPPESDSLVKIINHIEGCEALMRSEDHDIAKVCRNVFGRATDDRLTSLSREVAKMVHGNRAEVDPQRISDYFDRCDCPNPPDCIHFSIEDRNFLKRNPEYAYTQPV